MAQGLRGHRRAPARVDRAPVDVLRRQRAAGRRRPRQRLAQGPDLLAGGARRPHGRLPRHRRQRSGDDRPHPRERPRRRDAVRLRGPAADPAPARHAARSCPRPTTASPGCSSRPASSRSRCPSRTARSSSCRHPRRGLLRLRRAADGLRRRAPAPGRLVGQARARARARRLPRLPARAQRREHRRPAGRRASAEPPATRTRSMSSACATRGRPSTSQETSTWSFLP